MQLISPCRRGDSRSLLVLAMTVRRDARSRMAAPKSFEPWLTWVAVRGIMEFEVALRRAEARVSGEAIVTVLEWFKGLRVLWSTWVSGGLLIHRPLFISWSVLCL